MRAIQFERFGDPSVLRLKRVAEPHPAEGQIRIAVRYCGINPADWALATGLFADRLGPLPRGIGLEVSGVVDEVGKGVTAVASGDQVFGPSLYDGPTGGAAAYALMSYWVKLPVGLDLQQAAALTMGAVTAESGLAKFDIQPGDCVLVHGAGSIVGGAAVRLALQRGARVFATAGPTHSVELEALGVIVTSYGDGMVNRIKQLAGDSVRYAVDASPVGGSLPDLIMLAGDPKRVLTFSDFAAAKEHGALDNFGGEPNYAVLDQIAPLAANGSYVMPIAKVFALEDFAAAAKLSQSGHLGGKLLFGL